MKNLRLCRKQSVWCKNRSTRIAAAAFMTLSLTMIASAQAGGGANAELKWR
jgi:hypothetical protein